MFFAQELSTHFVRQDVALLLGPTQQITRIAQTLWIAIKFTFITVREDMLYSSYFGNFLTLGSYTNKKKNFMTIAIYRLI